ncbi:hypothetical protein BRC65_02680 [Halobacteriales archaeon QH_2_65_14]|nr:MAG: hypothetical protein BRC65_02680 [Halobacteriales archaeon QH_2_65_14]
MSVYLAWPVLVTLAAGIGTLALISYLFQYRDRPGAKWFILTLAGQSLFCFAYGFGLTVFTEPLRRWLEMLALVGLSWLGVPFLGFALGYTGRGRLLRSRGFKLLLSFPALTTVLLPFNAWHGLVWRDFSIDPVYGVATVSYSFQPLAFLGILGAGTVVAVAAFLLVENAIVHDSESPTVTVSATIDGDDFVARVSDGGPGIPDYEVQTLQDGDETALEHGSGLGLWLVKWGVLRLGGDLTFESSGAGTTARVRLPYDGESAGTEDVSQTSSPSA